MSFPRYPRYKDSGVEWLGEVPEHWEVCALKRIASLRSGEAITSDSIEETGEYPVFGGNGVRGFSSQFTHDGHYVLIGRQGALCGNINYANGRFWASEHAVVATPVRPVETVWLGELMRAMNLNQYSVSAAQPGLSVEVVSRLYTVIPPLAEQTAIAAFLDRETAKIDALVAEQRRLMELLKEKRQAGISHAVTRGLNPHAPLKPSGIEWLGEVPAHWAMVPVKHIARVGNGSTPSREQPAYWADGSYPWLNSAVANLDSVTTSEQFVTELALRECHLPRISPPAILIGLTGQGKTRGMATLLLFEATINQHLAYIKPDPDRSNVNYIRYAIEMNYRQLRDQSESAGSTKGAITCEQIGLLKLPLPPLEEQCAIVELVGKELFKLDTLMSLAMSAIDLLLERRTALISAAVTGQIDVRGWEGAHASLPGWETRRARSEGSSDTSERTFQ